jgi:DNA-binding MarR family transcriptional regulator
MQEPELFVAAFQKWIEVFMRNSLRSFILYSKETGLSMSQIGALFHIFKGGSGVSDIGEEMGVSSAAASQMLERLVQQGLILRTEDPRDRRSKKIILTERGQQIMEASIRVRQQWLTEIAGILTPAEREQVTAAMTLLIEKTAQLEQPKSDVIEEIK